MQQKVHLLNVNNIGKDMGEEIYSNTLFNRLWHYRNWTELNFIKYSIFAKAIRSVPQKGYSYQTDREPLPPPTSSSTF